MEKRVTRLQNKDRKCNSQKNRWEDEDGERRMVGVRACCTVSGQQSLNAAGLANTLKDCVG